jgi:protein TonB
METKKYANKDVHAQRKKFFLIGLSLALAMVITAFEWTTEKRKIYIGRQYEAQDDIVLSIPITNIDYPKPPEVKPEKIKIDIKPIIPIDITTVENGSTTGDATPALDPDLASAKTRVDFAEKPEEVDSIFVLAEFKPEPKSGYANFYKELGKNIKYPRQAKQTGTEGKVFVQFVINKMGEPTDLKIINGIGAGCDEEAIRVIAKSKWIPGRQRGQPVKVRITLPVVFRLSH